jgi:general secretion pathway protein E
MGVDAFLLSSSLLGVLAQRLVRKVCQACGGGGCAVCARTGYAGRTGIFELLVADQTLRTMIHNHASEADLRAQALQGGMTLMRDDAQRLVRAGVTSAEEVVRVTRDQDVAAHPV